MCLARRQTAQIAPSSVCVLLFLWHLTHSFSTVFIVFSQNKTPTKSQRNIEKGRNIQFIVLPKVVKAFRASEDAVCLWSGIISVSKKRDTTTWRLTSSLLHSVLEKLAATKSYCGKAQTLFRKRKCFLVFWSQLKLSSVWPQHFRERCCRAHPKNNSLGIERAKLQGNCSLRQFLHIRFFTVYRRKEAVQKIVQLFKKKKKEKKHETWNIIHFCVTGTTSGGFGRTKVRSQNRDIVVLGENRTFLQAEWNKSLPMKWRKTVELCVALKS